MDVKAIIDKAVVSISDGGKLGYVQNLFFDPQALRLTALELQHDGERVLLPFDQVQNLGADAITVSQRQVIAPVAQHDWIGFDALKQRKVVDATGTLLGKVERITIEPATGRIVELLVHGGGILGFGGTSHTIALDAIRGIGAELITVTSVAPDTRDT